MIHDQAGGDAKYVSKNIDAASLPGWLADFKVSPSAHFSGVSPPSSVGWLADFQCMSCLRERKNPSLFHCRQCPWPRNCVWQGGCCLLHPGRRSLAWVAWIVSWGFRWRAGCVTAAPSTTDHDFVGQLKSNWCLMKFAGRQG